MKRSWERGDREAAACRLYLHLLILLPEQPPVSRHSITSSLQDLFSPNHPTKNPLLQNSHRKAQHGQSNSRKTQSSVSFYKGQKIARPTLDKILPEHRQSFPEYRLERQVKKHKVMVEPEEQFKMDRQPQISQG